MLGTGDIEMTEAQLFPSGSSGNTYEEIGTHYSAMGAEVDLMSKGVGRQDWLLQASLWHFGAH